MMTLSEAGRLGAIKTNKLLTAEKRKRAAKKGWRNRKKRLALSKYPKVS